MMRLRRERQRTSPHRLASLGSGVALAALAATSAAADGERYGAKHSGAPSPAYVQAHGKPFIFYVGGAIGEYWLNTEHTHRAINSWDAFPVAQQFLNERGSARINGSDFTLSAMMGLDYRGANGLLLGIEADANYLGFHRRVEVAPGQQTFPDGSTGAADFFTSVRIAHLETLRLRLGYTFHHTTLFMTGGLALGEVEFSQSINFPFSSASYADGRQLKSGWVLGAGIERQLSRDVSLRAEYLHADLGTLTKNFTNNCGPGNSNPSCGASYAANFDHRVTYDVTAQIARIGLKVAMHEFGGGPAESYKAGAVPGAYVDYAGMKTDFSGLYISPIGGSLTGKTKFALTRFNSGYGAGSSPYFVPGTDSLFGGVHTVKLEGLTFGAVLGYQKQFGNLLLGADVGLHTGATVDGKSSCTPDNVGTMWSNASASCSSHLVYHTAFRVRAGYAMDKWMFYVNGGPAFAKTDNEVAYGGTLSNPSPLGGPAVQASYFNEKGSAFTKGWTYGAGLEYEWKPGMIVGFSYNHTQLEDVIVDLRRLDGTTNSRRTISTDPDVIGSSLKIKLGDTAQAPIAPPPAPATQQVAAAAAPPPAPAAPAAAPAPQRPRPAAARPSAQRPAPAAGATPAAPAVRVAPTPATPADGSPKEPAPVPGKPQK
jgi:outer membrane immunogenic protein